MPLLLVIHTPPKPILGVHGAHDDLESANAQAKAEIRASRVICIHMLASPKVMLYKLDIHAPPYLVFPHIHVSPLLTDDVWLAWTASF
jgi:hypothetical protein